MYITTIYHLYNISKQQEILLRKYIQSSKNIYYYFYNYKKPRTFVQLFTLVFLTARIICINKYLIWVREKKLCVNNFTPVP